MHNSELSDAEWSTSRWSESLQRWVFPGEWFYRFPGGEWKDLGHLSTFEQNLLKHRPSWFYDQNPTQKLFARLLRYRTSALEVRAPWVPYCDTPQVVHRESRGRHGRPGLAVTFNAPCRKCEKCLRFRQMQWRERVLTEITGAVHRTWNDCLTFSPVHWAGVLAEAVKLPDSLPQHVREERAAYRHLQRYFDRLRKTVGPFRYCAFFERGGEHGRAHYHVLIHEAGRPILKTALERQWASIQQPRLVRDDAPGGLASYLTKYLTKDLAVRPRASLFYGQPATVTGKRTARREIKSLSATRTPEQSNGRGRPAPDATSEGVGSGAGKPRFPAPA